MSHGTLTGTHRMPKKPKPPRTPSAEPPFERVEFQASPEWVQQLDAAARAVGVSRSAYIRLACNKLMQADRREQGGE